MSDDYFAAIKKGDRGAVIRILAAEPSLAAATEKNVSAVLVAAYWKREDVARLIARQRGELSIHEAAALGDVDRIRVILDGDPALVNAFAPDGFQPLGLAAFFGRQEVVALLLSHGADPSSPSRNDLGVAPLGSSLASGHDRISRLLVEAGADVNAAHGRGFRPLHAAAEHRAHEMVALLLDRGADPTARNDEGMSAADFARSRGDDALARYIESRIKH